MMTGDVGDRAEDTGAGAAFEAAAEEAPADAEEDEPEPADSAAEDNAGADAELLAPDEPFNRARAAAAISSARLAAAGSRVASAAALSARGGFSLGSGGSKESKSRSTTAGKSAFALDDEADREGRAAAAGAEADWDSLRAGLAATALPELAGRQGSMISRMSSSTWSRSRTSSIEFSARGYFEIARPAARSLLFFPVLGHSAAAACTAPRTGALPAKRAAVPVAAAKLDPIGFFEVCSPSGWSMKRAVGCTAVLTRSVEVLAKHLKVPTYVAETSQIQLV